MGAAHFLTKTLKNVRTEMSFAGARLQHEADDQHTRRQAANGGNRCLAFLAESSNATPLQQIVLSSFSTTSAESCPLAR
jgi:hypothetical protein